MVTYLVNSTTRNKSLKGSGVDDGKMIRIGSRGIRLNISFEKKSIKTKGDEYSTNH